ncbi:hypothetical protein BGZ63DRAFT_402072 [Mariannaea sp. PMI_226]|nr:hypothetical protein BGZ63DRAFT_402072 [Mariannaea sp. PMI_226]
MTMPITNHSVLGSLTRRQFDDTDVSEPSQNFLACLADPAEVMPDLGGPFLTSQFDYHILDATGMDDSSLSHESCVTDSEPTQLGHATPDVVGSQALRSAHTFNLEGLNMKTALNVDDWLLCLVGGSDSSANSLSLLESSFAPAALQSAGVTCPAPEDSALTQLGTSMPSVQQRAAAAAETSDMNTPAEFDAIYPLAMFGWGAADNSTSHSEPLQPSFFHPSDDKDWTTALRAAFDLGAAASDFMKERCTTCCSGKKKYPRSSPSPPTSKQPHISSPVQRIEAEIPSSCCKPLRNSWVYEENAAVVNGRRAADGNGYHSITGQGHSADNSLARHQPLATLPVCEPNGEVPALQAGPEDADPTRYSSFWGPNIQNSVETSRDDAVRTNFLATDLASDSYPPPLTDKTATKAPASAEDGPSHEECDLVDQTHDQATGEEGALNITEPAVNTLGGDQISAPSTQTTRNNVSAKDGLVRGESLGSFVESRDSLVIDRKKETATPRDKSQAPEIIDLTKNDSRNIETQTGFSLQGKRRLSEVKSSQSKRQRTEETCGVIKNNSRGFFKVKIMNLGIPEHGEEVERINWIDRRGDKGWRYPPIQYDDDGRLVDNVMKLVGITIPHHTLMTLTRNGDKFEGSFFGEAKLTVEAKEVEEALEGNKCKIQGEWTK